MDSRKPERASSSPSDDLLRSFISSGGSLNIGLTLIPAGYLSRRDFFFDRPSALHGKAKLETGAT
jgi:hypothetical protein